MSSERWGVTDHLCRFCSGRGRVLVRHDDDGRAIHRCSICGTQAEPGGQPHDICMCGARWPNGRIKGIKCQANADKRPGNHYEVVMVYAPPEQHRQTAVASAVRLYMEGDW